MSSSSGAAQILTSPTEQQANAPESTTMDAKLMVATASGGVQQLKDMVKEQESEMMVVVMAEKAAPVEKYRPGNMDLHLQALASFGSYEELGTLLNGEEDGQASGNMSFPASSYGDDTEANKSILAGVTAEGDTALHLVAACGQGDNFFTRRWCWRVTRAERDATYGDNFLKSACIIHTKDKKLLFAQNNKKDTPLHCAARAGKSNMVDYLIDLALDDERGEDNMIELLRIQNEDKETALHQAVRVGNNNIVSLLMEKDPELASFPEDGGASPMYLAIMLIQDEIVKTLYDKSRAGNLNFSGPNGQNALHAAVIRYPLLNRPQKDPILLLLKWNKTHLCPQNKDLTTQRDKKGSTPLHFAAEIHVRSSTVCRRVLEANPDALYQPDHAGFFPIHVAASVGAFRNVAMFVEKCPGSAGLRDANGRTFLHVAVLKRKKNVIRSACRNLSLSWIMNMVDNDGNTALHLAVGVASLKIFCYLLSNPHVNLSIPNSRGETPFDIAKYMTPEEGLFNTQNSEQVICRTLRSAGAVKGVHRQDHFEDDIKHDKSKEMEVLKDSTQTLSIGSVLIATVTFGAIFAVPGGYISDDKNNGGTPVLARRYAFDAFVASNTLAFVFSAMATIALMQSGSPLLNPKRRRGHFMAASYFVSISVTSLAAAFALGAYVVLAPVSHKTAVATCVLASFVPLYTRLEFMGIRLVLLLPLSVRKGSIWASVFSATVIVGSMLIEYWPLIFIFGWAVHAKPTFIQ